MNEAKATRQQALLQAFAQSAPRTAFLDALRELFDQQGEALDRTEPVAVYVAGGAAVHWWTRDRMTDDVDVEFAGRFLPLDRDVEYVDEAGHKQRLYVDRNYNPMFSLLHENYQDDAISVTDALGLTASFDVKVLSPVHLAISKLARFSHYDKQDIRRLAAEGLIDPEDFEAKARDALGTAIGLNKRMVEMNLVEALQMVKAAVENDSTNTKPVPGMGC